MSDHDELRDLLHRVVPDAPDPEPTRLASAGRRVRARRRTGMLAAAAVAVVVAVGASAVLRGDSDPDVATNPSETASASPTPTATRPPSPATEEPYTANTCPDTAPVDNRSGDVAPISVPDLTTVVAITYCAAYDGAPYPLTPEAFVGSAAEVRPLVEATTPMRPMACRLLSSTLSGFVSFHGAGGNVVSIAPGCEPVRIGATTLIGRQLPGILLAALDGQRDALGYHRTAPKPACGTDTVSGPVDPDREVPVAAQACLMREIALPPVDATGLRLLTEAWRGAVLLPAREANACYYGAATSAGDLRVTTDRGDTVDLHASPCGYLVLSTLDGPMAVPVTLRELGADIS